MADLRIFKGGFGCWQTKELHPFITVYKDLREAKRTAKENGFDTISYLEGTMRPKLRIINV